MAHGGPEPAVRLARRSGSCQAGNAHPLAPQRVSLILALEIEASRKANISKDLQELIRKMAAENPTWGE
jgi:hypothetical protein